MNSEPLRKLSERTDALEKMLSAKMSELESLHKDMACREATKNELEKKCRIQQSLKAEKDKIREEKKKKNNDHDQAKKDVLILIRTNKGKKEEKERLESEKTELETKYAENNRDDMKNGKRKRELEKELQEYVDNIERKRKKKADDESALRDGEALEKHWDEITKNARELKLLCETTRNMLNAEGDIVKAKLQNSLSSEMEGKIDKLEKIAEKADDYLSGPKL